MCERQIHHKILDLTIIKRGIKVTSNEEDIETENEFSRMKVTVSAHILDQSLIFVPNVEGGGVN